jgi:hypothetical protein
MDCMDPLMSPMPPNPLTSLPAMALRATMASMTRSCRWPQLRQCRAILGYAAVVVAMPLHALAAGGLPATVEAALQRAQVPREALSVVVLPAAAQGKGAPLSLIHI